MSDALKADTCLLCGAYNDRYCGCWRDRLYAYRAEARRTQMSVERIVFMKELRVARLRSGKANFISNNVEE